MEIRRTDGRAVTIADPEFPRISVGAGDVVDVPEALAKSLLEQSDRWEAVGPKPKKAAKSGEEE